MDVLTSLFVFSYLNNFESSSFQSSFPKSRPWLRIESPPWSPSTLSLEIPPPGSDDRTTKTSPTEIFITSLTFVRLSTTITLFGSGVPLHRFDLSVPVVVFLLSSFVLGEKKKIGKSEGNRRVEYPRLSLGRRFGLYTKRLRVGFEIPLRIPHPKL